MVEHDTTSAMVLLSNYRRIREEALVCSNTSNLKKLNDYLLLVDVTLDKLHDIAFHSNKKQVKFVDIRSDIYYWILKLCYIDGNKKRTGGEIINLLEKKFDIVISPSTYLAIKNEAILLFSKLISNKNNRKEELVC